MTWNPISNLGRMLSGAGGGVKSVFGGLTRRPGEEEQRAGMQTQGAAASDFAGQGEKGFGALGGQLSSEADYMRKIARGEESVSAEQLRQALGQNLSAQQSMAAGAAPQNQAMAALQASRNSMQLGSGLAGQQALAGMQERQSAQQALAQMLLNQRGQDLQAAIGSRGNAVNAYGGMSVGQSPLQQFGGLIQGGLQTYLGGRGSQGQGGR